MAIPILIPLKHLAEAKQRLRPAIGEIERRALMLSMPAMNTRSRRLAEIPGMVPAPQELGRGCAFAARCGHANDRCRTQAPGLTTQGAGHTVACFGVEENRLPPREEALA